MRGLLALALALALAPALASAQPAGQPAAGPPSPASILPGGGLIERIQFRGNRKVEDDAVRANLESRVGERVAQDKIRSDVRALWKMGFFEDVQVEASPGESGVVLTYVLAEKPTMRHIYVAGSSGLGLDKINEVLDLKKNDILDVSKVKKNVEKVRDLYVSKGYFLASVDHEVRPVGEHEVDVYLLVKEHSKVEIREVTFSGNKAFSDDELRGLMSTRVGGFFSFLTDSGTFREEDFSRDLALLTAAYYDKGFINVQVSAPRITLSADRRFLYVDVPIEEGPVFTIGKLDVRGDLLGPKADYLNKLKAKSGEVFARSRLGQDMARLGDHYKDRGYAYANITPVTGIDVKARTVDVTFEIEKGKQVYFERINIRGNTKTRDKVIRREMKVSEGELYSATNLEVSRRRINALGFFEKVDVSTRRGSSEEFIEVNIEVAERPTGTFQIGAGFSSVENFIAQAQVAQNNMLGRGQQLSLQAQLSSLRQLFLLRFVEPYFLDTKWTFAFDVYNQSRAVSTFSRNATGGNLTWGYPLSYEARAYLTYKAEWVDVSTSSSNLILSGGVSSSTAASSVANLFRGGFTSSVRASLSWDSRDNRLFPTRGFYHSAWVEYADEYTGSENVFVRWGGFSRYYRPIVGPFILKLNAEFGVVTSNDRDGVPISERYLVGGINDVRGFSPRTLGPQISVQSPGEPSALSSLTLGGNLQLIWNSEIEFPLFARVGISGVVFFDAGNAYNLEDKWCGRSAGSVASVSAKVDPCFSLPRSITEGLRTSVGFGFRWFSPLGPLRFEWGIPLDRQAGEEPLVFEFTIGNFF